MRTRVSSLLPALAAVALGLATLAPSATADVIVPACYSGTIAWTATPVSPGGSPGSNNAIPGASYKGALTTGGEVDFTVSADGTGLTSYLVKDIPGDTCNWAVAEGDAGYWAGAAISSSGAFNYTLAPDAIVFQGSFGGSGSASGTISLHNVAVVTNTGGGGNGGGGGNNGGGGSTGGGGSAGGGGNTGGSGNTGGGGSGGVQGNTTRHTYSMSIVLHKHRTTLVGRLNSAYRGCNAKRVVKLQVGHTTIAQATTDATGAYSFKLTLRMRGRKLSVAVVGEVETAAICSAGRSPIVRA
jgi:hypothetical protein